MTIFKIWRILATIFYVLIFTNNYLDVHANPLVPCYFIFGDSLADPGNNNGLKTLAKTNYKPYGIDYPGGAPTGRFTNGLTSVDVIAELLGFKERIPPYSTASGYEILKGVNYASGAAGISKETGSHLGDRISLDVQVEHHKKIIGILNMMLNQTAGEYLSKCIYTFNIGSNDYLNNYYLPKFYQTSRKYTPQYFASALLSQYSRQLKIMYESGARKMAVFALGPIGCSLAELALNPTSKPCVVKINRATNMFNKRLKVLVKQLNHQLPNATFTFINSAAVPVGPKQGIKIIDKPCCKLREDFQCKEFVAPCKDRQSYYFFDGVHPTEAVNRITGGRAFQATATSEAFPYDISHLAKL
ncbi:hypothetical protein RND81_06G098200 [Saponaria officinalis]|uniref:Uncharacterized protein n=1 Tax=Saponaria officinalis TaxID=3572 RepID=A0AAW1K8S2_SAPOF